MNPETSSADHIAKSHPTFAQDVWAVVIMFALATAAGFMLVPIRHRLQPRHPDITLAEIQARVTAGDTLILDARDPVTFSSGHIPGAVNLPVETWKTYAEKLRPTLRRHRDRTVIIYCSSRWCSQAENLQLALIELGHRSVGVFADGMAAWREAKLPIETSP